MRGLPTGFAAALPIASLLLSGCGGGEGEPSAPNSATERGATVARGQQPAKRGEGASARREGQGSRPGRPEPLPPPTPGAKAAAPGVPTSKHGDNSIQRWGLEASAEERLEASAIVQRYLDARADRDWGTVCALLAAKPRREQSRFAGGASCAEAMASFARNARRSVLREEAEIDVLSFRVGSRYAFLIYRRPDGLYAMALTREGGEWKLVTVSPNPLT